jgi:hypothetical protein
MIRLSFPEIWRNPYGLSSVKLYPFGVTSGVASGRLWRYFSLRIHLLQIALACSSEAQNGLSVPRDLRYASFVMFDILHLENGRRGPDFLSGWLASVSAR